MSNFCSSNRFYFKRFIFIFFWLFVVSCSTSKTLSCFVTFSSSFSSHFDYLSWFWLARSFKHLAKLLVVFLWSWWMLHDQKMYWNLALVNFSTWSKIVQVDCFKILCVSLTAFVMINCRDIIHVAVIDMWCIQNVMYSKCANK